MDLAADLELALRAVRQGASNAVEDIAEAHFLR